jgi:phosphoribosylformylglycinamidine synthase subunit PurL
MALAGNIGAEVVSNLGHDFGGAESLAGWWFGETQVRYLVVANPGINLGHFLHHEEEPVRYAYRGKIGMTGGSSLVLDGSAIPLTALREASDSFFRDWMEG